MKKILFAAFAASLLAAGCQKTEVYQPANSGEKMTFSTEMKKITKVEDPYADGLEVLHEQGFNVWAFADYDRTNVSNVSAGGIFDGMENWYVDYIEPKNEGEGGEGEGEGVGVGSWDPRKEYYWPGKDKKLRFYAVSAATSGDNKELKYNVDINEHCPNFKSGTATIEDESGAGSSPTDNFELQVQGFVVNAEAPNEDLMVADFKTQDQTDRTVDLAFHHTLSKVEFLFKTAKTDEAKQPKVYVQKITVSDMCKKGTLNVTPSESGELTAPDSFKWSLGIVQGTDFDDFIAISNKDNIELSTDETIDFLKVLKDGKEVNEYEESTGLKLEPGTLTEGTISGNGASFATWLMLPQQLTDKTVEIIYVINNRQFKAIFPLATDNVSGWTANSYTKYTVSLLPNLISFTANTETWKTSSDIDHIN